MNRLLTKLATLPIARYLVMAVLIVLVEIGAFALLNSVFGVSYLVATPASMLVGIVLNWYFSKKFVFGGSSFGATTEFFLVFVASLVGVGIQLAVVSLAVETLGWLPIIGKTLAIGVTFFWNFWVRKRFIFKG